MNDRVKNAKRKIFHVLLGALLVLLLDFNILNEFGLFLIIFGGIILSVLSKKMHLPMIGNLLNIFEKKQHRNTFPGKGTIFYMIGVFFVVTFFDEKTAFAAIMILALADPASYVFGMRFGKMRNPLSGVKFLEGFGAGVVAGFIGALLFVPWPQALAGAFFAMVAESIEIKMGLEEVDDNIIIPIVAAVAITVMASL